MAEPAQTPSSISAPAPAAAAAATSSSAAPDAAKADGARGEQDNGQSAERRGGRRGDNNNRGGGQRHRGRGGRGARSGRGGRGGGGGGGGDRSDSRNGHSLKSDRRRLHEQKRQRWDDSNNQGQGQGQGEGEAQGDGEKKGSNMNIPFSAEEIAAEDRRPKRKVAVLIGYAGTGYKGMQINHDEKTIEGDLFAAFVAAGAIQKMNADDPKKSSFVRCARTDKGVHAAGNVISLKLTVDDDEIVDKINRNLPEQIRVWGIQRTNNAFNCYQACDSRWYEYLLPSYTLLPPHPQTYLGKKVIEAAKEKGVWDDVQKSWADVKDYWDQVEKNDIQPILAELDDKTREEVLQKMHAEDVEENSNAQQQEDGADKKRKADDNEEPAAKKTKTEPSPTPATDAIPSGTPTAALQDAVGEETEAAAEPMQGVQATADAHAPPADKPAEAAPAKPKYQPSPAEIALKKIKAAYVAAKRRYRTTPERIGQLQAALDMYKGTNNFHNYTIQKKFNDPSAKRHIRSFEVNPTPIQIRDTEWLSLKVHGQSFMMHQIRKMVAMAVLTVRCAVPVERIRQSYGPTRISIPKAPGLGLWLERPVFESYSKKAQESFGREALNFDKYEKDIEEFKHRQIYTRIWDTEEKEASFHVFIHQLDSFQTDYFLWVTAHGFDAAYEPKERYDPKQKPMMKALERELVGDDEDARDGGGDEG